LTLGGRNRYETQKAEKPSGTKLSITRKCSKLWVGRILDREKGGGILECGLLKAMAIPQPRYLLSRERILGGESDFLFRSQHITGD